MPEESQDVLVPENETQDPATSTGEQQTAAQADDGLPKEASERTKSRFDTLTNELREERQKREALEKAFSTLKPKEAKKEVDLPIYDPDTGLLNEQALNTVQLRAQQAEEQAHKTQAELQQLLEDRKRDVQIKEDQEAYTAHPELNPEGDAFNKDLRDVTAALMLKSMIHPEEFDGKQLTHKEAGDRAKALIAKISGNVREEAAKEAIEQLSPKEQAALEATGSRQVTSTSDLEVLKRQTRSGDINAIMARLKNVKSQQSSTVGVVLGEKSSTERS